MRCTLQRWTSPLRCDGWVLCGCGLTLSPCTCAMRHYFPVQCQTTSLAALLDAGADINLLSPSTKESALVVAACYGHVPAIRLLLTRGGQPFPGGHGGS